MEDQRLDQRLCWLATGFPNSFDGGMTLFQGGRQTIQVQKRIGYEHQTPVFLNGFSVAHAIFVEAQMFFAIPIKSLDRPALQVSCDYPIRSPLHAIGNQQSISASEFLIFKTDDRAPCPKLESEPPW